MYKNCRAEAALASCVVTLLGNTEDIADANITNKVLYGCVGRRVFVFRNVTFNSSRVHEDVPYFSEYSFNKHLIISLLKHRFGIMSA